MGQRELRLAGVRFILGFDFVYEIVKGISRKIANMKRTLNSWCGGRGGDRAPPSTFVMVSRRVAASGRQVRWAR